MGDESTAGLYMVSGGEPGDSAPVRVVLAEAHASLRMGMRMLLENEPDIVVVGEARDLDGAALEVEHLRPDVLVLALKVPGGLHPGMPEALGCSAETKVVFATMENDPVFAQSVLAAGAHGFVCKDHAEEELAQAVRAAARGEQFLSAQVVQSAQARKAPVGPIA